MGKGDFLCVLSLSSLFLPFSIEKPDWNARVLFGSMEA